MFDWIGDALGWLGNNMFGFAGDAVNSITDIFFDLMLEWVFHTVYGAISEFFESINELGADIFSLAWTQAVVHFFNLFGWALFAAGLAVAVFDTAIEYQSGRANIQSTFLNILKGFMAVSLFTKVPVELYKFCITLQSDFSDSIISAFMGATYTNLQVSADVTLKSMSVFSGFLSIILLIAFGYCVVKLFFANIKRGGILLCQIAVGSLYMFSVPRGYADGFNSWCKQIFALCLTAFLQTTLLFLGLVTWQTNMILGLGVMLAANEVPRIAQQFGLDTSVRVNMMSVSHTVNSAISAGRFIAGKLR